jgi:hypothetical protein
LREAITAAKTGQRQKARDLLLALVEQEPRNEMAWLWLSEVVDDLEDKMIALENALTINPGRLQARTRLEQWRRQKIEAETGQATPAADPPIAPKRPGAAETPPKPPRAIVTTSPTLTLIRLTAGPPIFFGLLIFVHSGLNPLHLSPLFCLSGLGVLLGSLLMAGARYTPEHVLWQKVLGQEGVNDVLMRFLLLILGLLFMAIPFLFFLISALNRLEAYGATMPVR